MTERFLGKRRLGTTGRGIGPTYADKMSRVGIRVQDLLDEKILRQKVEASLEQKNQLLVKVYNRRAVDPDEVVDDLLAYTDRLQPLMANTGLLLTSALDLGGTVLLEGGQRRCWTSTTAPYPFVTSSNATAGGACTGSGIPPTRIDRVVAVIKAYTTRVGRGRSRPSWLTPTESGCARPAPNSAPRPGGHDDAGGTTRRSRAMPVASTGPPTSSSPSSMSSPGGSGSRCAWPTTSTDGASTICR